MIKPLRLTFRRLAILLLLVGVAVTGNSQYLRTSYFMDGAQYRLDTSTCRL